MKPLLTILFDAQKRLLNNEDRHLIAKDFNLSKLEHSHYITRNDIYNSVISKYDYNHCLHRRNNEGISFEEQVKNYFKTKDEFVKQSLYDLLPSMKKVDSLSYQKPWIAPLVSFTASYACLELMDDGLASLSFEDLIILGISAPVAIISTIYYQKRIVVDACLNEAIHLDKLLSKDFKTVPKYVFN